MNDWHTDKRWSDRFLPEIKRILGETFIGEAPAEDDAVRNTDLIVLRLRELRFACRVRKHHYMERYRDEFTIRSGRTSGNKTELAKIAEGWGDYLFYGFCDESEQRLAWWCIIDLNAFRTWFVRELLANDKGVLPGEGRDNGDGRSSFRCFKALPALVHSQAPVDLSQPSMA